MYEIGKVYIWQNQVGPMSSFNGQECTVLGPPIPLPVDIFGGAPGLGQMTDFVWEYLGVPYRAFAVKGDLRPKNPPSGEQSILSLFTQPVVETV